METVRFFVPSRTCGKPPFLRKKTSPAVSFVSFLQEKKSSSLPFLSKRKRKQKKVICGAVALRCCCLFRQRATQNGRFIWKPSVFSFRAGHAGNRLFSERKPPPQCLLFLFFKKRNRPPFLFFLERKGSKRKSSAEQLLFAAVAFFANVLHKTDGSYGNRPFFRSEQDMRETAFSPKENLPRSVFCFFSSRKEIVLP